MSRDGSPDVSRDRPPDAAITDDDDRELVSLVGSDFDTMELLVVLIVAMVTGGHFGRGSLGEGGLVTMATDLVLPYISSTAYRSPDYSRLSRMIECVMDLPAVILHLAPPNHPL